MRHSGAKKADFEKWDSENLSHRTNYAQIYFLYAGFPSLNDLSRCPEPQYMKNLKSHILHIKGNVKNVLASANSFANSIRLIWGRVAPRLSYYSLIAPHQKLNCFPGMSELCRKDSLTSTVTIPLFFLILILISQFRESQSACQRVWKCTDSLLAGHIQYSGRSRNSKISFRQRTSVYSKAIVCCSWKRNSTYDKMGRYR